MELPQSIATYIAAANQNDIEKFASAFTWDAIVHDDGKTHHGIEEIIKWKEELQEQFEITNEVAGFSERGNQTLVNIKCTGNFPGSPILFKSLFLLEGGKIKELKISE